MASLRAASCWIVRGAFGQRTRDEQEDALQEEWSAIDEVRRRHEEGFYRAFRNAFLQQRTRLAAALAGGSYRGRLHRSPVLIRTRADEILTIDSVFDLAAALEDTLAALDDGLRAALEAGFETGAVRIAYNGTFDADDPVVQATVDALNRQMHDIPVHTRRALNRIILSGQAEGKAIDEIAEGLLAELTNMSRTRARRIAATTATTSFEAGQESAWSKAASDGFPITGSTWLSQRDTRVSEGHWEADGQTVSLGALFKVRRSSDRPYEWLRHPGDPTAHVSNIVNCRCSRLPVVDDPVDGSMDLIEGAADEGATNEGNDVSP